MISIQQRASVRGRIHPSTLRRRIGKLLTAVGEADAELSIVLTDDAEIRELNRVWRHKDSPTDVLSFSQEDLPRPPGIPRALGDVVVSVQTADRQRAGGALPRLALPGPWSLLAEVTFLVLHGVLHLLGHDHLEETQAEAMEALEAELLPGLVNRRRSA